ncbi:hypothetical protein LV716_14610 [Flagellimonas sp. HMM57]|uniref:hypothetical protein n=1 Tax=unclassified Flagellimonas TaxID=2644544 RepID=UPI0013D2AD57|nr:MULTISPECIES: hypothetical protein [unclassified Flagellimonas]UII75479.1 hypothetical protein LV716_14610 [Flagellimonas sp. HMM57]
MKKQITLLFIIFFSIGLSAQLNFESGYFIDNSGNKTQCLIQSEKWIVSPEKVLYKLDENSEIKSFAIENCLEFRIGDAGIFKKITTNFPITPSRFEQISINQDIEFVSKTVFVQKIVGGKASLYWFSDEKGIVYLYSKEDGPIQPLIYYEYVDETQKMKKVNTYKSQLIKDFECGNTPMVQQIKYNRKSLIKYFKTLNECSGYNEYVIFKKVTAQKNKFPITLKAWVGIQRNTFEMGNSLAVNSYDDENLLKYGAEVESFFPYFGLKDISVFFAADYSRSEKEFNATSQTDISVTDTFLKAEYEILEMETGLRYYIPLSPKNYIFVDAGLAFNIQSEVTLNKTSTRRVLQRAPTTTNEKQSRSLDNDTGGFLGIGYSYNKRVFLRFNWRSKQNILNPSIPTMGTDEISRKSISLGYSFW